METTDVRLLLVDDDASTIRALSHMLADYPTQRFATSGEEALGIARGWRPDLVLLDVDMPGMTGLDLCDVMKHSVELADVPVIFVTSHNAPQLEALALERGAADFIAKPHSASVLRARVRNQLARRRTLERVQSARDPWRGVSDARLAEIVRVASDAIVAHDASDRVVLANAAACRLFGSQVEDMMGAPIGTLMGGSFATGPGHGGKRRISVPRSDGSFTPAEASVFPVGVGPDRLTAVMLRDVSDRERLERETHAHIDADAASRTRMRMLSTILHDIGNPLNAMIGFADLMARDTAHPLAAMQARRLALLMTAGEQLRRLLHDLTDVGRSEKGGGSLAPRPMALSPCVASAAEVVAALAAQAGVTLKNAADVGPALVRADPDRLLLCVVNLLSNAIKYNRPGGSVRIEVVVGPRLVGLSVHDDGLGMDEAQRAHLFEPFNRLGRQSSAVPGIGLGLVVTRQLVQAMGGQLRVESTPGQGSSFTIELPAGIAEAGPDDRAPRA